MTDKTVPDELLLLALSAAAGRPPTTDIYDLIDYDVGEHEAMVRALRAVLPKVRADERAKVAEEMHRAHEGRFVFFGTCDSADEHDCHRVAADAAARALIAIARGGSDATG